MLTCCQRSCVCVWIIDFNHELESLHFIFLRSLLEVPKGVANLTILAELGQQHLSLKAWLLSFKYWLRIHFSANSGSLLM